MGTRVVEIGTAGWEAPNRSTPFEVDGVSYGSLVHWIEADRARAFHDEVALAAILEAPTAEEAVEAGAGVVGFEATQWDEAEALRWGLLHVCQADEGAAMWLDRTRHDTLVVAGDARWGIGEGADPEDPETWSGSNLLGRALMAARDARSEELPEAYRFGHDIITKPRPPGPVVGKDELADAMSPRHLLFGFGGALRPRDFLIGHGLAGVVAAAAVPFVSATEGLVLALGALAVLALYGWMVTALYAKRLHSTILGGLLALPHVALVGLYLAARGRASLLGWGAIGLIVVASLFPVRGAEAEEG